MCQTFPRLFTTTTTDPRVGCFNRSTARAFDIRFSMLGASVPGSKNPMAWVQEDTVPSCAGSLMMGVFASMMVAFAMDELCVSALGVTCARWGVRALDRGLKRVAAALMCSRCPAPRHPSARLAAPHGDNPQRQNPHTSTQRRHSGENLEQDDTHQDTNNVLSQENVLAHEKELNRRGDGQHDWSAVRQHKQHRQLEKVTCFQSPILSASSTIPTYPARVQPGWTEQKLDKLELCSTACPSIRETQTEFVQSIQTLPHAHPHSVTRGGDVALEKPKKGMGKIRKEQSVTPADIMARWNLGGNQSLHLAVAI